MRIQARQCPFTREIFLEEDRDRYIQHLRDLRERMRYKRELGRIKLSWKEWLNREKEKITDISDLAPWFLENQKYIMKAYNAIEGNNGFPGDRFFPNSDVFTDLFITGKYNERCSNSHCCPENGVTNWCGRVEGAPRGYPGFYGRIGGCLQRKKNKSSYPASDLFKFLGIHTGSGGGGNENWGYDVTVFVADWPNITQKILFEKVKNAA